ncbi:hypothetical protein, partial [Paenibacillus odorifer]|uniref:hypothetical protein n=1 Tax=Paenibacillus odorifer TaxID=189426 RepID=UPI001C4DC8B9
LAPLSIEATNQRWFVFLFIEPYYNKADCKNIGVYFPLLWRTSYYRTQLTLFAEIPHFSDPIGPQCTYWRTKHHI